MCLNNFFYDRESKTGTLLVLSTGQVGFVETLKNFVLAVFWNSDAGILDRNKYFFAFLGGLNGDFRIMVAELDESCSYLLLHKVFYRQESGGRKSVWLCRFPQR